MLCFKNLIGMLALFVFVVISIIVFGLATFIAALVDYENNYHDDDDDDPTGFLTSEPFYNMGDFDYWKWGLISVAALWSILFLITLVGRIIDWILYAGVHCGHYTSRAFCMWLFCGESFCKDCEGTRRKTSDYELSEMREMHAHHVHRWSSPYTDSPTNLRDPGSLSGPTARAPGQLV